MKPKVNPQILQRAISAVLSGGMGPEASAKAHGIGKSTLYRVLRDARAAAKRIETSRAKAVGKTARTVVKALSKDKTPTKTPAKRASKPVAKNYTGGRPETFPGNETLTMRSAYPAGLLKLPTAIYGKMGQRPAAPYDWSSGVLPTMPQLDAAIEHAHISWCRMMDLRTTLLKLQSDVSAIATAKPLPPPPALPSETTPPTTTTDTATPAGEGTTPKTDA